MQITLAILGSAGLLALLIVAVAALGRRFFWVRRIVFKSGRASRGTVGSFPCACAHFSRTDRYVLCRAIVEDGLAHGASGFVADVEAPSPSLDTPAYEDFGRLGFTRPYARIHYALP